MMGANFTSPNQGTDARRMDGQMLCKSYNACMSTVLIYCIAQGAGEVSPESFIAKGSARFGPEFPVGWAGLMRGMQNERDIDVSLVPWV
jgi:hypothetical protein